MTERCLCLDYYGQEDACPIHGKDAQPEPVELYVGQVIPLDNGVKLIITDIQGDEPTSPVICRRVWEREW